MPNTILNPEDTAKQRIRKTKSALMGVKFLHYNFPTPYKNVLQAFVIPGQSAQNPKGYMILRWADYLGLSKCGQSNHMNPEKWRTFPSCGQKKI